MSDLPIAILLGIIVLLTAMSAYFSASETAMMALNRYRLRHLVKEKHRGARKANRLLRQPDRLLGVILFGNNLVNFTAASLGTIIGQRMFGDTGFAVVVIVPIVLTLYFLIFAEVAPKTFAAAYPERLAFRSVYLLEPLLKYTQPVVKLINSISNALVKPFTRPDANSADQLSLDELRTVVNEGANQLARRQNMMLGVLDLEKVTVNDIMVPRAEIQGLDIDDDIPTMLGHMANAQHTRLPVYKDNVNNVVGMLHLRRMARFIQTEEFTKAELMQLTEEPYYVPEATPLHTQLFNFQKEKRRIALVVDEYGDVDGIVTLEDILEEIVGEFTTDFTANMPEIITQADGSFLIDGLTVLRDINRALGWHLPTDGPKTLSGLVLEHLETIPDNNLCLKIDDYFIETVHIKDNVVKSLKIVASPEALDSDLDYEVAADDE